jgi:hypothetical protein
MLQSPDLMKRAAEFDDTDTDSPMKGDDTDRREMDDPTADYESEKERVGVDVSSSAVTADPNTPASNAGDDTNSSFDAFDSKNAPELGVDPVAPDEVRDLSTDTDSPMKMAAHWANMSFTDLRKAASDRFDALFKWSHSGVIPGKNNTGTVVRNAANSTAKSAAEKGFEAASASVEANGGVHPFVAEYVRGGIEAANLISPILKKLAEEMGEGEEMPEGGAPPMDPAAMDPAAMGGEAMPAGDPASGGDLADDEPAQIIVQVAQQLGISPDEVIDVLAEMIGVPPQELADNLEEYLPQIIELLQSGAVEGGDPSAGGVPPEGAPLEGAPPEAAAPDGGVPLEAVPPPDDPSMGKAASVKGGLHVKLEDVLDFANVMTEMKIAPDLLERAGRALKSAGEHRSANSLFHLVDSINNLDRSGRLNYVPASTRAQEQKRQKYSEYLNDLRTYCNV